MIAGSRLHRHHQRMRNLIIILGDQLDRDSSIFDGLDPAQDMLWIAECTGESTHVWSHKVRIVMFLAAMRHFRDELRDKDLPLRYRDLESHDHAQLVDALREDIEKFKPQRLLLVKPGEWRLREALQALATECGIDYVERPDRHFLVDETEFIDWAKGRKQLRMEYFYRWTRKHLDVLMEDGKPAGGAWNYDHDNRHAFGRQGPGMLPAPRRFRLDDITREVIDLVEQRFGDHPGELAHFDWPLTPHFARIALKDFIEQRLPAFGHYQDAMWTDEPWLYHARLSAAMNLKLLHPRAVIDAAVQAWRESKAEIAAVEGFVRQILGWREFIRGVYWLQMPQLTQANALGATQPLPDFYWTGDTDMACMRQALGQTLKHGYAHHIQRLMVTGTFALMLGVEPAQVHAWYLAIYVDAVEWAEAPNVLGMSQFADGGKIVSKPYCASGRYIQRMSNYCDGCRYQPGEATGENACPFTTLYWDFLERHQQRFAHHPRAALQWKSLERLDADKRAAIGKQATALRAWLASPKD